MRRALHVEVLLDGELFLHRTISPGRPLRLGQGRGCDLPTTGIAELTLLRPFADGYGLRLASPLEGRVRVGGRWLRIAGGLLCDPRPEPLRLVEGDGGEIRLDERLRLRFSVVSARPAFAAGLRPDPRLAFSLAGTLAVALVLIGLTVRLAPPAREAGREVKLQTRPARLMLASSPRPPASVAAARPAASSRIPRLSVARREAGRRRGLLGLLDPRLQRPGRRAIDPLAAMDRLLASTTGPGLSPRRHAADEWLTGPGSGLGLGGGTGERVALPTLSAPSPRDSLATASEEPSREAIREVVARGSAGIRVCYERELLSTAEPREGQLVLRWRIDGSGRPMDLKVRRDTVQLPGLTECVLRQVRGWLFPRCAGRCTVVYPFEFFTRS